MWSILRNLTTNKTSDTARIISKNCKNYVSLKQKANVFVKLYRSVSSLKVEKPDRGLKKLLNGLLRSEPVHSEECREFTLSELNAALKSLNPSKAPGPDTIHPRLLHHLGPIAVNTLLRICNLSWSTMEIPQPWRVADVRPVLKAGKDAQLSANLSHLLDEESYGEASNQPITLFCEMSYSSYTFSSWVPYRPQYRGPASPTFPIYQ